MDILNGPANLRRWSIANLIANMVIVWTGALVRLTKSGLGCPTWPQCDATSYTPHPESEWHAYIEFGNRLLTFVLILIAVGTVASAWRARRAGQPRRLLRVLTIAVGVGILAQAVIGGISVLTQLNPWVVGLHMVASVALVVVCTRIVHEAFDAEPAVAPRREYLLVQAIFWLSMVMMYLGTVVTGSGPHSGDGGAQRNGFVLTEVARLHSLTMWAVVGLTVLLAWLTRQLPVLNRAAIAVLACAALQAVIGYTQYLTHLPLLLVLAHLIGTTLFTVAIAHLWFSAAPLRPAAQKNSGSMAAARKTTAR